MKHDLSALRRQYEEDGAVMVPSLIDAWHIARIREPIDALVSRARRDGPGHYSHGAVQLRHAVGGRITIHWLWREYAAIRQFFDDQSMLATLAGIIGARQLRLFFDNTFVHLPGNDQSPGSPWHSDTGAFPFVGRQLPSLWITLTDISPAMSPLRCLKGTHRSDQRYRPPVYVDPHLELPEGFAEMPDFEDLIADGGYEIAQWPHMRAGDALVIHPYTVHGAPGNVSPARERIAFTARLLGDDVRWQPTPFAMRVPGVDYDTVEAGAAPEGALFPLVWKTGAAIT